VLLLAMMNLHTKVEKPSFIGYKDKTGPQNLKPRMSEFNDFRAS